MIEQIKKRFENRLVDSEYWEEFYNNHEPDVASLIGEVERLEGENEKLNINAQEWEDEYMILKRRFDELDKSALETLELLKGASR